MIPKTIHYCWFGPDGQPLALQRCFLSWQYRLAHYKFRLWNEESFDVHAHPFAAAAYESGKYAFVADYVRMYALFHEGGIYLDTDVEILGSFDELLHFQFFIGLEDEQRYGTSSIGAVKGHWLPRSMLDYYDRTTFQPQNVKQYINVGIVSRLMLEKGFHGRNERQQIGADLQLPIGTFGTVVKEKNPAIPIARHLYAGSWRDRKRRSFVKMLFTKKHWKTFMHKLHIGKYRLLLTFRNSFNQKKA